jgi:hypothetical protein
MSTERIIGIDFGTSTTVVRVKTYINGKAEGSPVFVESIKFDGQDTLPSLVLWDDSYNEYVVGREAGDLAGNGMGELFRNFKLDLLNPENHEKAEELITHFFRYIYEAYSYEQEHFTRCDTEITYVSYPAKWPKEIADKMLRIAESAGFKNVKGLDEPSAAIHTVLIQKDTELQQTMGRALHILIIDMGAGTTDLALCRYTLGKKNAEIINIWPQGESNAMFGGREIDDALWGYVKDYIASCGLAPIADERPYLTQSKAWKEENVSASLKKGRPVTSCGFIGSLFHHLGGSQKPFPAIDRATLENLLAGYLEQFPVLINGILDNTSNCNASDIDLVVLTGGHSQWYFADEMLTGKLTRFGEINLPKIRKEPERVIRLSRPQETVSLGLVYQPMNVNIVKETTPSVKPETTRVNRPEPVTKPNAPQDEVFIQATIASPHKENEYAEELKKSRNSSFINIFFPSDLKYEKKLSGALTYAKLSQGEHPLFIVDTTVLGSAKDGMLLTGKAIHIKNRSIPLSDLDEVRQKDATHLRLYTKGGERIDVFSTNATSVVEVLLRKVLNDKGVCTAVTTQSLLGVRIGSREDADIYAKRLKNIIATQYSTQDWLIHSNAEFQAIFDDVKKSGVYGTGEGYPLVIHRTGKLVTTDGANFVETLLLSTVSLIVYSTYYDGSGKMINNGNIIKNSW